MSDAEVLKKLEAALASHEAGCLACKQQNRCWQADALARRISLVGRFDQDLRPKGGGG